MTVFRQETGEQPAAAERLLAEAEAEVTAVGRAIVAADPVGLMIVATGSSDHAAVYAKYLFETRNGLPVVLAAPSVLTLDSLTQALPDQLSLFAAVSAVWRIGALSRPSRARLSRPRIRSSLGGPPPMSRL